MVKPKSWVYKLDDPVMSDLTILMSLEDLINNAMGPAEKNVVNYKLVQAVLHILARQLRILQTKVEVRISEPPSTKKKKSSSSSPSSGSSPKRDNMEGIKEEKGEKKSKAEKSAAKEKQKAERAETKEKEKAEKTAVKAKEKEEKAATKEKEKEEKMAMKEKGKEEKMAMKEKEKAEKYEAKEQERLNKMTPQQRNKYVKEKEKAQSKMENMTPEEKNKYLENLSKEVGQISLEEREERVAAYLTPKEKKELNQMSSKEKEEFLKGKEKDLKKLEKMSPAEKTEYMKEKEILEKETTSPKEREKFSKEKELKKLEKMSPTERQQYSKEKETKMLENMSPKEREVFSKAKETELKMIDKMSPKEKEQYLKEKDLKMLDAMSPKEREQFSKEKEKEFKMLEKMTPKEREQYYQEKEKELKMLEKMSLTERELYSKEKDLRMLDNKSPKEREQFLKEKEKELKMLEKMSPKEREQYSKEKEKELKVLEKMSPTEIELYSKEKDLKMLDNMTPKEREQFYKEKELKMLEKMSPEEREEYSINKEKEMLHSTSSKGKDQYAKEKQRKGAETSSGSSIAISETERDNEKVLVVRKGPSVRSTAGSHGSSIEVVTQSQFELLKAAVKKLEQVVAPLPMPALPENKKLRSDLAKGTASLNDTMQAMQVSARVQAAEQGISKMAGLLTQLAASGNLPADIAAQVEEVKSEIEAIRQVKSSVDTVRPAAATGPARKSVAIDPMSTKASKTEGPLGARPSSGVSNRASVTGGSGQSRTSRTSTAGVSNVAVSRNQMDDAMQAMKDQLMKNVLQMTQRATTSADMANGTAKSVSDKMEYAMRLNSRISELHGLASDYTEQLSGFDAGVTTQMQSFQEQMAQMRVDLKSGLTQLELANNNAETAAVMELNERYEVLVLELDGTVTAHHHLTHFQKQLADELRSLLEAVETLREQKADRDEVWDGLRDKADNSKLEGLLSEREFATAREELEMKLRVCYEKFIKQEAVWMQAIKDLNMILEDKAHIMSVLAVKEEAQNAMRAIQEKLDALSVILGEPTVAVLTRVLSKDGHCASCQVSGLMRQKEESYGRPREFTPFRPAPQEEPCLLEVKARKGLSPAGDGKDKDDKAHICKRWVGGSHTLVTSAVARGAAPAAPRGEPLRLYTDYGEDGKLYRLAEELVPCEECNVDMSKEKEPEQPRNYGTVDAPLCTCWPPLQKH